VRWIVLLLTAMPIEVFTTPGANTWQRPPGVTTAEFAVWGGGAGGNNPDDTSNDRGGAGGGFGKKTFTGVTSSGVGLTIGAGGLGANGGAATAGGDTYIDIDSGSTLIGYGALPDDGIGGGTPGDGLGSVHHSGGLGDTGDGNDGGGGGGAGGSASDGGNALAETPGAGGSGTNAGGAGGHLSDGIAPGGGGGGAPSSPAYNGGDGRVSVNYALGSLTITNQPSNANSGAVIAAPVTVRIFTAGTVADTHASTAGAGNTVSAAILSGSGVLSGTTSSAYGTGADGSIAQFDDLVVSGSGSFTLRFTDDATGIHVDSSSFTITSTGALDAIASAASSARTCAVGSLLSRPRARESSESHQTAKASAASVTPSRSFSVNRDRAAPDARSNVRAADRCEAHAKATLAANINGAGRSLSASRYTSDTSHVLLALAVWESSSFCKSTAQDVSGTRTISESEDFSGAVLSVSGTALAGFASSLSASRFYGRPVDVTLVTAYGLFRVANRSSQAAATSYPQGRLRDMSPTSDHLHLTSKADLHAESVAASNDHIPTMTVAETESRSREAALSTGRPHGSVSAHSLSETADRTSEGIRSLAETSAIDRVESHARAVTSPLAQAHLLSRAATQATGNELAFAATSSREHSSTQDVATWLSLAQVNTRSISSSEAEPGAITVCCGFMVDRAAAWTNGHGDSYAAAYASDAVATSDHPASVTTPQPSFQSFSVASGRALPVSSPQPSFVSDVADSTQSRLQSTAEIFGRDLVASSDVYDIGAHSSIASSSSSAARTWLLQIWTDAIDVIGTGPAKGIVRTTPIVSGTLHGLPIVSGIVRTFDPTAEG
jgi:hypothetical protein